MQLCSTNVDPEMGILKVIEMSAIWGTDHPHLFFLFRKCTKKNMSSFFFFFRWLLFYGTRLSKGDTVENQST